MTDLHPTDLLAPAHAPLALQALAHFEREEAFLDTLREQLQAVHTALQDNDQAALSHVLRRQAELEHVQEAFRRERADWRRRAATALGVAVEDVHLRRLAERLSGEPARQLECLRRRLEGKLRETDEIRQRIASLAHCCLSFWQRFFLNLTGGGADCYSPAGTRSETACGSFIEVRG